MPSLRLRGRRLFWNLCDHFQIAVAAVPNFLSHLSGHNDALMRSASRMPFRISVHQKAATAESHGVGRRLQSQDVRTVVAGSGWRPVNGPVSARDWSFVGNILHAGIILALASPGIAACHGLAISLQFSSLLRVGPGKPLEVVYGSLLLECGDSRPRLSARRSLACSIKRSLDRFALLVIHTPSIGGCKTRSKVM